MTKYKNLPVRYVTSMRCATWNTWPAHILVSSEPFKLQPFNEDTNIFCQARLVSYEQRSPARRYSSRQPRKSNSPPMWRGRIPKHYVVGNNIIQAPTDKVPYKLPLEHAYKGEIDIQLNFAFDGEVEQNQIQELGENLSLSVMSYLNLRLDDFLTPSAALQIGEVIQEDLKFTLGFGIAAHERKTLSAEDLQNSIDRFQVFFTEHDTKTVEKLEVALNLYSNFFRQPSIITRFLTLVMVLEALAPQTPRPEEVIKLIERWRDEIRTLYSDLREDSEEFSALQNLEREISFRRHDSIRGSIRKHVLEVLSRQDNPRAKKWSQQAVKIYDIRSKLVHEGSLSVRELEKAERQAAEVVQLMLRAYIDNNN